MIGHTTVIFEKMYDATNHSKRELVLRYSPHKPSNWWLRSWRSGILLYLCAAESGLEMLTFCAPLGSITFGSHARSWLGVARHARVGSTLPDTRRHRFHGKYSVRCSLPLDQFPPYRAGPAEDDLLPDEPVIVDLSPPVERRKKVKVRTSDLIKEIQRHQDVGSTVDTSDLPPIHKDELAEYARTAVRAADKRKALNPVAMRVSRLTCITSFMVFLTGKNPAQIRAISNLVEKELYEQHGIEPRAPAQHANSGWLLLDYGDIMIHVFLPETRKFYNVESFWSRGEALDVSDCLQPDTSLSSSSLRAGADGQDEELGDDDDMDDWLS